MINSISLVNQEKRRIDTCYYLHVENDEQMNTLIFFRDIFLLFLYVLTSLLALIGNILVCRASVQRRYKLFSSSTATIPINTTHIFLLNLAIADTLSGFSIPITLIFCSKYFLQQSTFSSYICVFNKSIQILGYNASTLTICVIAFDRYRLVQNPLEKYQQRKTSRTILLIWLTSGLFAASSLISLNTYTYFNLFDKIISCKILFPSAAKYFSIELVSQIRIVCLTLFFYIIPLAFISILCILTMRVIARRSIIGVRQFQTFEQSRTRSLSSLLLTVIAFALSHLPIHLIYFRDFISSLSKPSSVRSTRATRCDDSTIYLFSYWLSMCSCCQNPLVYSWFNRRFRTLVRACCQTVVHCRRH